MLVVILYETSALYSTPLLWSGMFVTKGLEKTNENYALPFVWYWGEVSGLRGCKKIKKIIMGNACVYTVHGSSEKREGYGQNSSKFLFYLLPLKPWENNNRETLWKRLNVSHEQTALVFRQNALNEELNKQHSNTFWFFLNKCQESLHRSPSHHFFYINHLQ